LEVVAIYPTLGLPLQNWQSGENICLAYREKRGWKAAKEKELKLFHPNNGRSHNVVNTQPINASIKRYYANNVRFLP
jgi:hypothetical protein